MIDSNKKQKRNKFSDEFDSPEKSLHNLVSLLLTQQRGQAKRNTATFAAVKGKDLSSTEFSSWQDPLFNNETTDKCGRLVRVVRLS
jgi:hypothetical protein